MFPRIRLHSLHIPRPVKNRIKKRRLLLDPLRIMQNLQHKRQMMDLQPQPVRILHLSNLQLRSRSIVVRTAVPPVRVPRPYPLPRGGHRVEEMEYAFEEKFLKGRARGTAKLGGKGEAPGVLCVGVAALGFWGNVVAEGVGIQWVR